MQSKTLFTLSCFGGVGLILAAGQAAHADPFLPVPPASFLNYHVGSADQLAQEVALDAVVRARLARHFHQSEPSVTRYIHDNLVLMHLAKPGTFRVACVTPSGREYFLTQHLAAGTGVFSLRSSGKPILKQACGNPLVAVLPAVAPKPVAPPRLALAPKAIPAKPVVVADMPSDVVFTDTPPLEKAQVGGIGPFVRVAGITQSLGHSGGGGLFPAVLGAAGLGLFAGHHGGSSSSSTTPTPVLPGVPVPAAPVKPPAPTSPPMPIGTMPVTSPPVSAPPVTPTPVVPVTPTPITPTTPVTPTTPTGTTPVTPTTPPTTTPPVSTLPVVTPPTDTTPFTPPTLTPPTTTPPFIGPPQTTPPSQSAVPEPGPVVVFGLGVSALGLLCLRARRGRARS